MMTLHKAKAVAAAAVILVFTGLLGVALVNQAVAQLHGSKAHAPQSPSKTAQPSTAPADKDDAHAAAAEKMKVTQVVPILQVGDLQTSMEYYENQLGFKTEWTHGDPASFASISRDGLMIFLQQGGHHGGPQVVYMVVNDVNAMHDDIAARGAQVVDPPQDRPWGMREMVVKDPDENHIRIGTMTGNATEPVKPKGK
jgi:predicted enzyme related to lactoylglutathione lyase